jgi:hypothetical protein
VAVAKCAIEQLQGLTGLRAETVSEIRFEDPHWHVVVEVTELARIPPTTDVLGSYAVQLDANGVLLEYRRLRRYHRNQTLGVE